MEVEKFILAEGCTINSRLNASCPNSFATCNGPQAPSLQMLILWMPQQRDLIVLCMRDAQCRAAGAVPCTPQNPLQDQSTQAASYRPGCPLMAPSGALLQTLPLAEVKVLKVMASSLEAARANDWVMRGYKRPAPCFHLE